MRQRRSEKHTLTHRDAHATVPNCFGSCRWHGYQTTLKQACFQGYPESAVYVQVPIGSRNSAIHNAYHTSLRPSSLFEPRHPSLKVVFAMRRWTNHPEAKTSTNEVQTHPPRRQECPMMASQCRRTIPHRFTTREPEYE